MSALHPFAFLPGPRLPTETHTPSDTRAMAQLLAFQREVSSQADEGAAMQTALNRVVAATGASAAAVVSEQCVARLIGTDGPHLTDSLLHESCGEQSSILEVPGHGSRHVLAVPLGRNSPGTEYHLLALRPDPPFTAAEQVMITAMGAVLGSGLDSLAALASEYALRVASQNATERLHELSRITLARFSRIQRAITSRDADLVDVLDAILDAALELLECQSGLLRVKVIAGDGHGERVLTATAGLDEDSPAGHRAAKLGRRSQARGEPVVENRSSPGDSDDVDSLVGVPVEVGSTAIGHLVLGSPTAERMFTELDTSLAETLAEYAGLAVQDADTVRELEIALAETNYRASHDSLTGLTNREAFLVELARVSTRKPSDDAGTACLLYLDLDRFKQVNDTLGHPAGDELLIAVAQRLRRQAGPLPVIARLGGDEFVVLLERLADDHRAMVIAEQIVSAIAEPLPVHGHTLHPSASVGITVITPGDDPTDVLSRADAALYESKRNGRGRVSAG